jgi:hypothetical protein
VFCTWDEFTSDTAVNRLFKCACRFLSERVNYQEASRLLLECQERLSEVQDVSPVTALRGVLNLRLDRSVSRFRTAFDLARRLLAGVGHNLGAGNANTFVFLLDMNQVFESYVHAVLEAHFETSVEEQKFVGKLFRLDAGGVYQKADYFWLDGATCWIGDAKYKHLAKGQNRSLRFTDFEGELNGLDASALAGRILSPDDVRQLTVYAELVRLRDRLVTPPELMLLYPFVGSPDECVSDKVVTWNGSTFWLMPVQVRAQQFVGNSIRFHAALESSETVGPVGPQPEEF